MRNKIILSLSLIVIVILSLVNVTVVSALPTISISNPYIGGTGYKGQLHMHTTWSDGSRTPAQAAADYLALGYNFICITDHQIITPDPTGGILYISGVENWNGLNSDGKQGHINIISASSVSASTNPSTLITNSLAVGGLAQLNHPNYDRPPKTPQYWSDDDVLSITNYKLIEISNGGAATTVWGAEDKWDTALTGGKIVWGTATDDSHGLTTQNKGWVIVYAPSLTSANILSSLNNGNFYSSTGPTLAISVVGNIITATTTVTNAEIQFKKTNGEIVQSTLHTLTDSYTVIGNERYIRVAIIREGDGKRAWSQPLFISKTYPLASSVGNDINIVGNISVGNLSKR